MSVQILYATMTGHSKKIAKAICAKTGGQIHDLKTKPSIPACDILFIVSGIYGGESKLELLEFVKKLSSENIKKVVLITSSTRNIQQGNLREALSEAGLNVINEEYHCQGGFLLKAMGHPNRSEVEGAVDFALKRTK